MQLHYTRELHHCQPQFCHFLRDDKIKIAGKKAVRPSSAGLPFAFSEQALQVAFLQFAYAPARKMRDCKGSISLLLGFQ